MNKTLIDKEIKLVTGGISCQIKTDITPSCARLLGTNMRSSTHTVDMSTENCRDLMNQIKLKIDNVCGENSGNSVVVAVMAQ